MDRKLLVLDIDGTLVFAEYDSWVDEELISLNGKPHFTIQFKDESDFISVWKRPFLDEFLEWALNNFDVAIWSASGKEYVHAIVQTIFPTHLKEQLKFIWTSNRYFLMVVLILQVYNKT